MLKCIANFLCLLSDDGTQLNLSNCAFILLTVKMVGAHDLDWPAVVTLMTVFANEMHKRHCANAADIQGSQEEFQRTLKAQASTIEDIKNKIAPIIEQVKGLTK